MTKQETSNGKAVAYLRLSYVKGEGGTLGDMTLEDQLASCQGIATQRGLTIEKIYNEGQGMSAFKAGHRPEWDRMLDELEPGTTVLGWATSRISRNSEETWRDIDKRGGIVVTADGNTSEHLGGKQAMAFAAVVDEFYSLRISTQVKEGQARARREGRRHGGRRPFGYWSENGYLTINQDEAAAIRTTAKNLIEGSSIRAEAIRLNEEEVPTSTDKIGAWAATSVKRIMTNKNLLGLMEMPDGELRKVTEPILDAGTFKELQNAITTRTRSTKGNWGNNGRSTGRKPATLLAGIGVCSSCGSPLSSGAKSKEYRCSARSSGRCVEAAAHGSKTATDAHIVIALWSLCVLLVENSERLKDPERLEALAAAWGTANDPTIEIERKRLQGEIEVGELQVQTMADKLASNDITVDAYAVATETIGERLKNLKEQLDNLAVDDSPVVWVDDVRAGLQDAVDELLAVDTPDAKKRMGNAGGPTPVMAAQKQLVDRFITQAGGLDAARQIIATVFKSITMKPPSVKYAMFVPADRIEYELAV